MRDTGSIDPDDFIGGESYIDPNDSSDLIGGDGYFELSEGVL